MRRTLPNVVIDCQPFSVNGLSPNAAMQESTSRNIRDNVRAILRIQPGESGISKLIAMGFANGTAQRILGGATSLGTDVVDKLAAELKVPVWRLVAPALGGATESAWPFDLVDMSSYQNLSPEDRAYVQGKMEAAIEARSAAKAASTKQDRKAA